MNIKPRTGLSRKQKSYRKWMGLTEPKTKGRLPQLNKHNRKSLHRESEALAMFRRLESRGAV